jgi:hypothetical protein
MSVAENFKSFCNDLKISTDKRSTISTRYESICKRLNKDFWNMDTTHGGRFVGSYGRHTANDWFSDIDMIFEMPSSLKSTYNTFLKGDGQIIEVSFSDGMKIEVLPAFKNDDNTFTYADTNNGGSWRKTNPIPEIEAINSGDTLTNNNLKRLCRMIRAWKYYCDVPIKGLLIDTLAYRFLVDWDNRDKSYLYYDWMSRDFFEYLKNQSSSQTTWYAVGSSQAIYNEKSLEAIQSESDGFNWSAKQKWREIYGNRYPS